jgi:hypothetical protein
MQSEQQVLAQLAAKPDESPELTRYQLKLGDRIYGVIRKILGGEGYDNSIGVNLVDVADLVGEDFGGRDFRLAFHKSRCALEEEEIGILQCVKEERRFTGRYNLAKGLDALRSIDTQRKKSERAHDRARARARTTIRQEGESRIATAALRRFEHLQREQTNRELLKIRKTERPKIESTRSKG